MTTAILKFAKTFSLKDKLLGISFDGANGGWVQRCNLTLARLPGASEYHGGQETFYLTCPIGQVALPQKLGIFKFMFLLLDQFFI